MKLGEEMLNVEKSDGLQTSQFRIKTTRKAFKILSDGLYSDKKKAIVRELSTNAFDSHVMAGKRSVPFQIHLPNDLEPWFSVKDWGTGLSDADVMSIYTTYFESNKTESNDVTGCLGLGSKSPFCYVDSFTVVSRFNGVERTYNAFISEVGVPSISKMGEAPTTEENGLEVRLDVSEFDFAEFAEKTRQAVSWFEVRPKVIGVDDFEFVDCDYYIRKPTYAIRKNDYSSGPKSHVVMGNVAYPFSADSLNYLSPEQRTLITHGVDLFMPIGSVEMSASRESLQFNKTTTESIKAAVQAVRDDLKTQVEAELQAAPDIWAARRKLWDFKEESPLAKLANISNFTWQGVSVTAHLDHRQYKPAAPVVEVLTFERERKRRFHSGTTKTLRRLVAESIYADGRPIFLNDMDRGAYSVVQEYMLLHNIKQAYMISENSPEFLAKHNIAPVVPTFLKENGLEKVVVLASGLPKPQPKPRVPRQPGMGREYAAVMELDKSYHNDSADNWKNTQIDIKSVKGIYVEVSYYRWKWGEGDFRHPSILQTIERHLTTLGIGVKVYGVRTGELPKVQKAGWEPLGKYIKDYLTVNKDLASAAKKLLCIRNFREHENYEPYMKMTFSDSSPFGKLIGQLKDFKKEVDGVGADKIEAALYLYKNHFPELIDISLSGYNADHYNNNVNGLKNPLTEALNEVHRAYPLMEHIRWFDKSRKFTSALYDYVTGLDLKVASSPAADGTKSDAEDVEEEAA